MAKKSYVSLHDRAYKGDVRQYSTYFSLSTFVLIIYSFPPLLVPRNPQESSFCPDKAWLLS